MKNQQFTKLSEGFYVNPDFKQQLEKLGLISIDDVFDFKNGDDLSKPNLAKHRSRIQIDIEDPSTTLFLKRYNAPPVLTQLKNWHLHHKRASSADFDRLPCHILEQAGINTYRVIAHGSQWNTLFEKRSFVIIEKIPNAESLEKKLPQCFYEKSPTKNVKEKRLFIESLADFARIFHETGLRHRDFYLAHIFMDDKQRFHLIDLQRTSKPILFGPRLRLKDLTQLYYSAPGQFITQTDRLRFYLRYKRITKLSRKDKFFLKMLKAKAWRIADHDIRHNRPVPFAQ